jgi:hypothetical protein
MYDTWGERPIVGSQVLISNFFAPFNLTEVTQLNQQILPQLKCQTAIE